MLNRRTFIGSTAGAFTGTILSHPANAAVTEFSPLPSPQDNQLKMLISTAIDAARVAGADYSDARLTFTQQMESEGGTIGGSTINRPFNRSESKAFGVRAIYDGYWGFASSTLWTKEEAARLGRVAVDSAKANFSAKPRDVNMAPNPGAISGDWTMPVTDDPFEMNPYEITDYLSGLKEFIMRLPQDSQMLYPGSVEFLLVKSKFYRQQKAFGNSEGQFVTQRLYRTGGTVGWTVNRVSDGGSSAAGAIQHINMSGSGCGFELFRTSNIRDQCIQLYERLAEEALLPIIPVDVGKLDCLVHPRAVAPLVKKTIGIATEIDRVMGFEANSTGTSYIQYPNEELGSLKIGSPLLNVTSTRALHGALTHVKWDDEGVEPRDIQLIKNGVVNNLLTGREGTAWMERYLQGSGQPILSSGSSYGIDAHDPQSIHPSDLVLHSNPGTDTKIEELREQIDNGLEFGTGFALMDFQQSTGMLVNDFAFQIKKGKRVARVIGPAVLFRTAELWGNLKALGGSTSVLRVGTEDFKSNPSRVAYSSVDAPATLFKELSIINPAQKA